MTIKAYRSTRYNGDRTPRQPRHPHETRRSGSFWGVSWQLEDTEDDNLDAMPGLRSNGRR